MPTLKFQCRFQGISNLSEDVFENVLYYDVPAVGGDLEGFTDGIAAAFNAWSNHAGINGLEIRVYPVAGGQPIYSKTYTYAYTGTSGPTEVALCLSYATVTNWDATTARRRGRIFLGPITAAFTNVPRPGATLIDATLALGQALYDVGPANEGSWQIYSTTDAVATDIASISVDNAWDTQRRRGLVPTARTVQTVPD